MKDQNKIISENESPIPLPPVDGAWVDMRRLLDEENPERAVPVLIEKNSGYFSSRWLFVLLLLLIGSVLFYFGKQRFSGDAVVNTESAVDKTAKALDHENSSKTISGPDEDSGSISNPQSEKNNITFSDQNVSKTESSDADVSTSPVRTSNKYSRQQNNGMFNSGRNKKPAPPTAGKNAAESRNNKPAITATGEDLTKSDGRKINSQVPPDSSATIIPLTKTDSGANTARQLIDPPPTEPLSEDWLLESGLFWTLSVPANSSGGLMMGPNGQAQPYRILLPGAWMQARHHKHILHLEINPFANSMPASKTFKETISVDQLPDTLVKTDEYHSMVKTFGISLGMGYQYNIAGNWWAGMSFQTFLWSRAVAQVNSKVEKIPLGNTMGTSSQYSSNYVMDDEWKYFNKFQMNLNAEAMYRRKNWQAGLRLGLSVTPFAEQDGPSHPFKAELFYRWRLFDIMKKNTGK